MYIHTYIYIYTYIYMYMSYIYIWAIYIYIYIYIYMYTYICSGGNSEHFMMDWTRLVSNLLKLIPRKAPQGLHAPRVQHVRVSLNQARPRLCHTLRSAEYAGVCQKWGQCGAKSIYPGKAHAWSAILQSTFYEARASGSRNSRGPLRPRYAKMVKPSPIYESHPHVMLQCMSTLRHSTLRNTGNATPQSRESARVELSDFWILMYIYTYIYIYIYVSRERERDIDMHTYIYIYIYIYIHCVNWAWFPLRSSALLRREQKLPSRVSTTEPPVWIK